jgi:hypothetical protein
MLADLMAEDRRRFVETMREVIAAAGRNASEAGD